jgi:hypothetical protein
MLEPKKQPRSFRPRRCAGLALVPIARNRPQSKQTMLTLWELFSRSDSGKPESWASNAYAPAIDPPASACCPDFPVCVCQKTNMLPFRGKRCSLVSR